MLRSCNPSDAVIGIEVDTGVTLFLTDELKAIVVDEHVGRTTLEFIEKREKDLDGGKCNEAKALVVTINSYLDGELSPGGTKRGHDDEESERHKDSILQMDWSSLRFDLTALLINLVLNLGGGILLVLVYCLT
ncbi:hypothetical protein HG530_002455 [Fusarium avenaceum]|nr:hypothetical protein HG530_002455 [Fusarium avenaceum]